MHSYFARYQWCARTNWLFSKMLGMGRVIHFQTTESCVTAIAPLRASWDTALHLSKSRRIRVRNAFGVISPPATTLTFSVSGLSWAVSSLKANTSIPAPALTRFSAITLGDRGLGQIPRSLEKRFV